MNICTRFRSNAASSRLNEDWNASLHFCIILYNLMPHKFIKVKMNQSCTSQVLLKSVVLAWLSLWDERHSFSVAWMMTSLGKALTGLNDTWRHQLRCNVNICLFWVLRTFYILHLHQGWKLIRDFMISSHFIVLFDVSLLTWMLFLTLTCKVLKK